MVFCCPQPTGKFWMQRFDEKGKEPFTQKLHNFGKSGRLLPQSPSPLEHPEEKPTTLGQTDLPKAVHRVPSPI